jgi:hypothetical protein
MAVRIQLRRDTATNWTTNNPVLAEGELGLETNSGRWKVGNGINAWTSLPYSNSIFSGPTVIADSSSGNAFRITQTGTGNAFVVEDEANPDATHFVINSAGSVGIGKTNPIALLDVDGGSRFTGQITSTVATGAQPFVVASTTSVTNLNADMLDGSHASDFSPSSHSHSGVLQPIDGDLTAIAALTATVGLLKKTAANTWAIDDTSYLKVTDASTNYQPKDGDLTAIAGITGTAGLLKKTNTDTWTLDTSLYALDDKVVHDTMDETIGGAKTFTNPLTVQSIVTANNYDIGLTTLSTDSINLNFSGETGLYTRTAAGAITFTATNYRAGAIKTVRIVSGAALRNLTFPASWVFVGTKPTSIAASKTGILTVTSFGTTEADCVAAWTVQS